MCVCVCVCVCVLRKPVTHISQIEEGGAHLCSPADIVMAQHDTFRRASGAYNNTNNNKLANKTQERKFRETGKAKSTEYYSALHGYRQ